MSGTANVQGDGRALNYPGVGLLQAAGTTVPASASTGYATGCIFHHIDGGDGTSLYVNEGTAASSTFVAVDPLAGGYLPLAGGTVSGTLAVTGAAALNGGVVINEDSADVDVRIESNALANFVTIDASELLNGSLAIGAAAPTNPQAMFALLPPANATGVTANQSYFHHQLLPSGAVTVPAGTAPVVASMNLHEPNITATGTVTVGCTLRIVDAPTEGSTNHALWVDAGTSRFDGNFDFSAGAHSDVAIANTAAAYSVTDGTTSFIALDTRNTVTVQNIILQGPASQTLPNGATSRMRVVSIPAKTVTLAGATQITTENLGAQMFIDGVTVNQSGGAVTIDRVSSLHVGKPVAGSSVTITANHIISTDTSGCFCTSAGTWTDTSGENHKMGIVNADLNDALKVIRKTEIKRFRYKDASDGNILRFGGIAEKVPLELSMPGREGIAARDVAWLAMAGVQAILDRLDKMEAA